MKTITLKQRQAKERLAKVPQDIVTRFIKILAKHPTVCVCHGKVTCVYCSLREAKQ